MSPSARTFGVPAVCILLLIPSASLAQETEAVPVPAVELSAGYMLLHEDDGGETYPAGWYVTGSVNATRSFGLVGEMTGSYKARDEDFAQGLFPLRTQRYTLLGGPRFLFRKGRIVPFMQVLAGVAHVRSQLTLAGADPSVPLDDEWSVSSTNPALQPGGGVSYYVSNQVGLRVAADYRLILHRVDDYRWVNSWFRAVAGVTLGWGER